MYTQELINQVKEIYKDDTKIIELAESGSVWLGRYLDDSSSNGISNQEIINTTSLKELQEKAFNNIQKINLYKEWCKQDPRKK